MELTAKQESFVRWYCSAEVNMNGTEAARRAGYAGSDGTLRAIASENLTKPNIRQSIDNRIEAALSGAEITIEKILRDLEIIREKAMAEDRFPVAIRCLELEGKYLGMFSGKKEVLPTLESVNDDQLLQLIIDLLASTDLDISALIEGRNAGCS